jgi:glycosyltransferase involved in cell wall biosynthesis
VAAAIESVLAQTRPVDEFVVIDDGSTDNTAEIVDKFRARGVRLIRQENLGVIGARNRGITETTGELIAFIDQDDAWLPEKTERQVKHLTSHPGAGLVSARRHWYLDQQTGNCWLEPIGFRPGQDLRCEMALRNCIGPPSSVMVRRSILDEIGAFDPRQIWTEDWELWMRVLEHSEIGFVDEPVMIYRRHFTNATGHRPRERTDGHYALSRQAIRRVRPAWRRPILALRARSRRELFCALCALVEGLPRWRYVWHASRALFAYPFEQTGVKLKHLTRGLFGEAVFDACQRFRRRWLHRAPASTPAIPENIRYWASTLESRTGEQ